MSQFVKIRVVERVEADIDWKGIADAVEELVMAKLHNELADPSNDRGMRAMYLGDAGDGLDVCVALAKGNWAEVDGGLWNMDTAAREYVYDFIEQVAGKEFFKVVNNSC